MSDIMNGKLIYQLTSASALKDTDLFVISSADNNLTRSVTLLQIKTAVANNFYNKEDMNNLLDELKLQIKELTDSTTNSENNISEFRNEFNTKLQELRSSFTADINTAKSEFNITITNESTSLQQKITELETKLTNQINGLISYGIEVPTTMTTKIYLQYF